MLRRPRASLAFLAFQIAVAIYGSVSYARSTPALFGRPPSGTAFSAFNVVQSTPGAGGVQNVSGAQAKYEMSVPLDSSGAHSGSITMRSPDLNATVCVVMGADPTGTTLFSSGFVRNSSNNVFQSRPWSVNVPASGYIWIDCAVGAAAIITKVDHSPN
jgi:hypothetical protein